MKPSNCLKELEQIFESPRLYGIDKYFTSLRTEIDLAFHSQNNVDQNKYKSNYIQMIGLVNLFEEDCYKKQTDKFNQKISQETSEVLNRFMNKETNSIDDLLIYKQLLILESALYLNRTLVFLKGDSINSFGYLLIVTNQYFGSKGVNIIKR